MTNLTDSEIIEGLLNRDNRVTEHFFYVSCRPLLTAIMRLIFSYKVDYYEMVGELYVYLLENDGERLRQFQGRSSLYQWMKVVATRFFLRNRGNVIENESKEPLYEQNREENPDAVTELSSDRIDLERMLAMMTNRKYADAIRHLIILDEDPQEYAVRTGVTVDNLYNIKKRAIAALTKIAQKYYSYGTRP